MIKLYQYSPRWNIPNISSFCLKLETYLRMANLPFEIKYVNNPRKSPKGKLPFIKDDGKVIADSSIIIDYLKRTYGDPLDQHLTPQQKADGLTMQRLIEDHLYWVVMYSRWVDSIGWPHTKQAFFGKIPQFSRQFIANTARKIIKKSIYAHGISHHHRDEVYQMGSDDIDAITTTLGDKDYLFGEKPTSFDASLYGILLNILSVPIESPLKQHTAMKTNLSHFCERITNKYYSFFS